MVFFGIYIRVCLSNYQLLLFNSDVKKLSKLFSFSKTKEISNYPSSSSNTHRNQLTNPYLQKNKNNIIFFRLQYS